MGETSDYYHYEAYFDRLLNYSEDEKKTWLSLEGWSTDTSGKFDDRAIDDTAIADAPAAGNTITAVQLGTWLGELLNRMTANKGNKKRHKLCC